jgi:hypothetical protein
MSRVGSPAVWESMVSRGDVNSAFNLSMTFDESVMENPGAVSCRTKRISPFYPQLYLLCNGKNYYPGHGFQVKGNRVNLPFSACEVALDTRSRKESVWLI